jgi:hypothetical protein
MKYALTIAIVVSLSFGLINESFRYQSTAGLFEDDYDLLFDPARIPEIEGSRLWTSLANFVSGDEELFSNTSQPYVLLGGLTHLSNYYPGLIYDRSSTKDPMNTGLQDPLGNDIYGEGEVTTIDWENPDTLGNYQDQIVTREKRSAFNGESISNFYVALGTKLNSFRFGLGFMHADSGTALTDPSNNYEYEYFEKDLEEDSLKYQETRTYAGDNITKSGSNDILFSAWMDKENIAFGLGFELDMLSETEEAVITGDEALYETPEHPDTNYETKTVLDSTMLPQSGTRIAFDLKAFWNYNENIQGRYYGGFFTRSTSYGSDAMKYYYETDLESYDYFQWDTINTVEYYTGSMSETGFRLGTKQLFSITENVKFGFGFFFNSASVNDSITKRDTSVSIREYDYGDTLLDTLDYTLTVWDSEEWAVETSGSKTTFEIPVGVEFNLSDPVVLRFGAQHTITKNNLTKTYTLAAWEPQVTRIEYKSGRVVETYEDPNARPETTTETDTEIIPATNYYYGLGWRVSKNLQLDLMGFNKITDWSNWKLSVTFHFD